MAVDTLGLSGGGLSKALAGLAFLSGAQVMADLVAKTCSSPQTMEINAAKRAGTLMKWVSIGLVEGSAFVLIAAALSPAVGVAFVAGGALEGIVTLFQYQHAKASGLASAEPGTESY